MTATALRPTSVDDLRQALADAHESRRPVGGVDLAALARVVAFSPEDMTVTVETGSTVAALQATLAEAGQWLPLDPPNPGTTTLVDVLQHDLNGPRRFGHGTVREHVLGMAMVTADGRLLRSGGRVVKNVAGYDLARLSVGDGGSLGVVVEVTFKLSPRPAVEQSFAWTSPALDEVEVQLERLLAGPTEPVVLDLHNLSGDGWTLVVTYAGPAADVAWQADQLDAGWEGLDGLAHDARFWQGRMMQTTDTRSVLPSRLVEHLRALPPCEVLARAGNGIAYTNRAAGSSPRTPSALERRLKATYDPHGILPALS